MASKRIRMRRSVIYYDPTNELERSIASGQVLRIPEDLDKATAAAWLKAGLAIEDKLDPRKMETK